MNAPLRPSVQSLVRACAAAAIGSLDRTLPARILAREWSRDSGAEWLLTRAPAPPADSANTPALMQSVIADFVTTLAPQSAAARVFREGLELTFGNAAEISVPTVIGDPSLAAFVREGYPIPVVQAAFEPLVFLSPRKLAAIVVLTSEMVKSSNLEALVTDALSRAVALALDKALFDDQPGNETRPAGLRYGITPIAADASPDPVAALLGDVSNLYMEIAPATTRPPINVHSLARATRAELMAPHGLAPLITLGSIMLRGTTDMIMIAPNAVASALGGAPEITAARENVLQMDSAPGEPNTGATSSTWQADCIAIKVRLPIAWALRTPAAVAYLTATHW